MFKMWAGVKMTEKLKTFMLIGYPFEVKKKMHRKRKEENSK